MTAAYPSTGVEKWTQHKSHSFPKSKSCASLLGYQAVLAFLTLVPLQSGMYGQTVTATLKAGAGPSSVAVNPARNKVYVANHDSGTVTVIDGASNKTATVAVGLAPSSAAVNPVTNKIYVANHDSGTVTVIDGVKNSATTITVGLRPSSLAVNPVTNKIYVANNGSSTVTAIDGVTNSTATIATGPGPDSLAVNPVTNKIYVANHDGDTVTVINGVGNSTATVKVGAGPSAVAVNPVTNKVYVANHDAGTVSVIDGVRNSAATITAGLGPSSLAINPVTNKVYVANHDSGSVTIIDGASNKATAVTTGGVPDSVAVNSTTNQIYVANGDSNTLTVVDGSTNNTTNLTTGTQPLSAAVNPVDNKVYVANSMSNNVTVIDGVVYSTDRIATGSDPIRVALNPVTNKIYVANFNSSGNYSGSVTVVDGATGETANVQVGSGPYWVAVNPVTNKIYVPNAYSNNVTVIDGATNNTTAVPVGTLPNALAVNPVTNKIYVADGGNPPVSNGDVTVIDGGTNRTTSVPAGLYPRAVAVNPVTDKIYVVNNLSDSVTVIDGATNTTTAVATGANPVSVAVNPATNKIYVVNQNSSTVTVIDGATNGTASVPVGQYPNQVAVNAVTNKIYVANISDDTVTVIDGATNATTAIAGGHGPWSLEVNPATNKIYVADGGGTVAVIDGLTNTLTTVPADTGPFFVAVNPITNKAYVVNLQGNDLTVVAESPVQPVPLVTTITPLPGNQTNSPNPKFTFSAKSGTVTTPDNVFFQLDTSQNAWSAATGSNPAYHGSLSSVQRGFHILYAYAADGQEATSTQAGSPLIGVIQAYGFLAYGLPVPSTTQLTANPSATAYGQQVVLTATVQSAAGQPTGTVIFSSGPNVLGSGLLNSSGTATLATNILAVGSNTVTATYLGNASYSSSTSTASETVTGPVVPAIVSLSPTSGAGPSQAFKAVYSDGNGIADLDHVSIVINTSGSTVHACYALYSPASNRFQLADDVGNETLAPIAPGQSASASNSQCTLSGAGSSVTKSGNTITATFALSFMTNFDGSQNIYLAAVRRNGLGTGAVQEGSWSVLASGLTLSRTSIAFTSNPNLPQSGRVYITNNSSQSVSVNPTIQGSPAFRVIGTSGTCSAMRQGVVCGINVEYKPPIVGTDAATLYLNPKNGPVGVNPKVALTGLSAKPAVLVSRPSLTFLTPVGTSDDERVYITNNLPYNLNLLPTLPSNDFSFVNDCTAIAAFQTCAIDIGFTPAVVEKISGNMQLNFHNAPAGTLSQVLLTANSGGSPPVLVSTTRVQLVTVMGTIVSSPPVLITNNTQQTVSVNPAVSGDAAFTFSSTCSKLSPKQTCAITVHFAGSADQVASASIALNLGNAPAHSPTTIQLTGFAPSPATVSVNGQNQSFTLAITANVGTFQTSVITVLNGTSHVLNLAPFFSGVSGTSSFQIGQPCRSIPSQRICQMTVSVQPAAVGISSATLNINPTNLQAGDNGNVPQVMFTVSGTPKP